MVHPRRLILFTKPAVPGRVKTRLIGELSAEEASELHGAFRDDLLARLVNGPFELSVAWALENGEEVPPGPAPGFEQEGRGLGERLYRALARVSAEPSYVAAVGSDHPLLETERVLEAFHEIASGADVALGPATDGGYYMIAIRSESLSRSLFEDIAWSTDRVLGQTLERCAGLGLRTILLEEASDVDTAKDLARLEVALSEGPAELCPRTRRLLERWGRLEPA